MAGDPLIVSDPAFVLTFGATLAILVIVPVTRERTAESAVSSYLWPMFMASMAAEAVLFPIGAVIFSRVTFAGLGPARACGSLQ